MRAQPTRIHFSTVHGPWPWLRQTPGNDGRWEDFRFQLEDPDHETEWLVVFDEPSPALKTTTPYERRILFITEPPEMKTYELGYVNQFRFVVCPYVIPGFRGRHLRQQSALNWHYGVDKSGPAPCRRALEWSALAADKPKSKLASVICSNKTRLPQHRLRLAFVERLQQRLGDRVDVFGHGLRNIDDKQEAIADYKFHIVLENNMIDHFWTEKLADAYLGDAFPIFSGCGNLGDYFDRNSFRNIDVDDPDEAVDDVENIINSSLWEDRRDLIREARRKVMHDYNCFAVAADVVRSCDGISVRAARTRPTVLRTSNPDRLKKLRRQIYKLFGVSSLRRRRAGR
jgi:hypothetical protein